MARESQLVHDLGHLLVIQRGQVAVAGEEKIARKIVTTMLGAAGDQRLGISPERRHPLDKANLLVLIRSPPHEEQATLRTRLDAGHVLVRDAEHAEDDERGQVPGQIANQVGPATGQALLYGSGREFPHKRFHGGDTSRGEGDGRESSHAGVPWWVTVRERWDRAKASLGQEVSCRWADRLQWCEGVGRGEPFGCLEYLPDIVVASDDPVVEVWTVEHRGGRPCLCEEGVRIGQVWIMKWIERFAPVSARIPIDSRPLAHALPPRARTIATRSRTDLVLSLETGHGESAFGTEALPSKNQEAPTSDENVIAPAVPWNVAGPVEIRRVPHAAR